MLPEYVYSLLYRALAAEGIRLTTSLREGVATQLGYYHVERSVVTVSVHIQFSGGDRWYVYVSSKCGNKRERVHKSFVGTSEPEGRGVEALSGPKLDKALAKSVRDVKDHASWIREYQRNREEELGRRRDSFKGMVEEVSRCLGGWGVHFWSSGQASLIERGGGGSVCLEWGEEEGTLKILPDKTFFLSSVKPRTAAQVIRFLSAIKREGCGEG